MRHRMRRNTQAYSVLAAGERIRNVVRTAQNQREGSGPEPFAQAVCCNGNFSSPMREMRSIGKMDDERMILRPAFGGEDFFHRVRIRSIGTQTVHRFSGKRDQSAAAQYGNRFFDI